jgi:hypothetical protein
MIEQYICELLYKYDSVILPGFGAFILTSAPSVIHQFDSKISPPAKFIAFDTSQKNNDGILANYLSEKEKVSFFDACSLILNFVEQTNKSLDEGNQIILAKIGTLSKTCEGISFIPDTSVNYNQEAFGMDEVVFSPILRDDVKEKLQKQYAEKVQLMEKRKNFPKVAVWLLIAVVLIGGTAGALLIIKPAFINNINLTGLFKHDENKDNLPGVTKPGQNLRTNDTKDLRSADTLKADSIKSDSSTVQNISSNQNDTSMKTVSGRFYIISASFRVKENSENYVQTLKEKGYNSQVIFLQDKGMYVVSYNSFATQAEAEQALSKIRETVNPGAWLLNN